jgi:hypothetical protein
MKPSPEKLRHVFQLTAAALVVIRRAGKWQKVGSWRLTSAESGGLKIAYRSPFNLKPADLSSAPSYVHEAARRRAAPDLPHKLDIWAPQKVLSVQWDDAGAVNLISFKPGEWEAALNASSG